MEKWDIEMDAVHCVSLKMYGFCSSNALYSEPLPGISTRMFDTFDDWGHYFKSKLSLELIIKVFFIKKHVTLFLCLLKKKNFATWNYFCVHLVFHWGDIVKKFWPKAGGLEKRKKEGWSYSRAGMVGVGWGCL